MTTTPVPEDNLNIARRKLNTVLEDKADMYFTHLKQWFRMKTSKDHFDAEARKMLTPKQVQYHNEFLLALLNKVDGLAHTSISLAHERAFSFGTNYGKPKAARVNLKGPFDAVDLIDYLPPNSPQGAGSDGVQYVSQEVFLPDHSLVMGRFMLTAWDAGLEAVEDDAANVIVVATQQLLKNVLHAVIASRRGYKKRGKSFMYDSGADVPNMFLRNSTKLYDPVSGARVDVTECTSTLYHVKQESSRFGPMRHGLENLALGLGPLGLRHAPMLTHTTAIKQEPLDIKIPPTIDEMEHAAAMESACSSSSAEETLTLTVEDVYLTLLEDRNVIGSHSVYTTNLERMSNMLSHPSE